MSQKLKNIAITSCYLKFCSQYNSISQKKVACFQYLNTEFTISQNLRKFLSSRQHFLIAPDKTDRWTCSSDTKINCYWIFKKNQERHYNFVPVRKNFPRFYSLSDSLIPIEITLNTCLKEIFIIGLPGTKINVVAI